MSKPRYALVIENVHEEGPVRCSRYVDGYYETFAMADAFGRKLYREGGCDGWDVWDTGLKRSVYDLIKAVTYWRAPTDLPF